MVQILRPVDPFKLSAFRGYLYLQVLYKVLKTVDPWTMEEENAEMIIMCYHKCTHHTYFNLPQPLAPCFLSP